MEPSAAVGVSPFDRGVLYGAFSWGVGMAKPGRRVQAIPRTTPASSFPNQEISAKVRLAVIAESPATCGVGDKLRQAITAFRRRSGAVKSGASRVCLQRFPGACVDATDLVFMEIRLAGEICGGSVASATLT